MRLFIPWAAPASGRDTPSFAEVETLAWLFGEIGLVRRLSQTMPVQTVIMPADSYAKRNGYDMTKALRYWVAVKRLMPCADVNFFPASALEAEDAILQYQAQEAYALEKLKPATRDKIIQAAVKYSGEVGLAAYEAAGDYAMRRAAESRYVENDLQALWVSLNWPERDAMCGDAPRIYVPEMIRTPWLKEA